MLSDKICPYCGAENMGLDLKELNDLFVCIMVDTKTEEKQTELSKQEAEKREK